MTEIIWKEKQKVCMLTNMHKPLAEGNFSDENDNALKSAIMEDCNRNTTNSCLSYMEVD